MGPSPVLEEVERSIPTFAQLQKKAVVKVMGAILAMIKLSTDALNNLA
jgi:hypothetical protein